MPHCDRCGAEVIRAQLAGHIPILLDPTVGAYVTVDPTEDLPVEGSRVFLGSGLMRHDLVCPAQRKATGQKKSEGHQKQNKKPLTPHRRHVRGHEEATTIAL